MAHQRRFGVSQAHGSSVKTTTAKILRDIDEGRLSHTDGANETINKRKTLQSKMRDMTSPVGRVFAYESKPAGSTVED